MPSSGYLWAASFCLWYYWRWSGRNFCITVFSMLQIRKEQWDVFAEIEEKKFRTRLANHLLKEYPDRFTDVEKEDMDIFIDAGLERARSYGLSDPKDILAFFVLMLTVNESFDSHHYVRSILSDQSLPASSRMKNVLYETPPSVWRELDAP